VKIPSVFYYGGGELSLKFYGLPIGYVFHLYPEVKGIRIISDLYLSFLYYSDYKLHHDSITNRHYSNLVRLIKDLK